MIFRQLFDSVSSTYSYVLASRHGGEALIIDPVLEKVDRYLKLMEELDLRLVKAVDTHLHADHITGLGALRDRTKCITVMGEQRADSNGRRNTREFEVAMGIRKRRSDRSGRAPLPSPGRPPAAGRDERSRFWLAIASGMSSEDAALEAGVSQP